VFTSKQSTKGPGCKLSSRPPTFRHAATLEFPHATRRFSLLVQQSAALHIYRRLLPGDIPGPGQTPLPPDLEQAAVEQVAYWFQNRDKLGLLRNWPHDGTYQQLSGADLLPSVAAVLQKYKRWSI